MDHHEKKHPKEEQPAAAITPEEIEKIKSERDEYLNGWKRAKADFVNYQKEEARRATDMAKFSNEQLIRELLPVLDSFHLALLAFNGEGKAKAGVEMIHSQLIRALSKWGLEPIKAMNEPFDPELHEALEEVESGEPPGTVVEELEKGWKLHGRVIRPARVKVAKSHTK